MGLLRMNRYVVIFCCFRLLSLISFRVEKEEGVNYTSRHRVT